MYAGNLNVSVVIQSGMKGPIRHQRFERFLDKLPSICVLQLSYSSNKAFRIIWKLSLGYGIIRSYRAGALFIERSINVSKEQYDGKNRDVLFKTGLRVSEFMGSGISRDPPP